MDENGKKTNHSNLEIDKATNTPILDHEYDGIQELDNDLPGWYRYLFYLCILFAIGYLMKYHVFKQGKLQEAEYIAEFPVVEEATESEEIIAEVVVLEPLSEEAEINAGLIVYQQNCAVCHLKEGQGLVGPNLTDEYWIHGGSYENILQTIIEGVPLKGMIPWKTAISKKEIEQVASFIWTLQGTNPPNPKKPEGEKHVRE